MRGNGNALQMPGGGGGGGKGWVQLELTDALSQIMLQKGGITVCAQN